MKLNVWRVTYTMMTPWCGGIDDMKNSGVWDVSPSRQGLVVTIGKSLDDVSVELEKQGAKYRAHLTSAEWLGETTNDVKVQA